MRDHTVAQLVQVRFFIAGTWPGGFDMVLHELVAAAMLIVAGSEPADLSNRVSDGSSRTSQPTTASKMGKPRSFLEKMLGKRLLGIHDDQPIEVRRPPEPASAAVRNRLANESTQTVWPKDQTKALVSSQDAKSAKLAIQEPSVAGFDGKTPTHSDLYSNTAPAKSQQRPRIPDLEKVPVRDSGCAVLVLSEGERPCTLPRDPNGSFPLPRSEATDKNRAGVDRTEVSYTHVPDAAPVRARVAEDGDESSVIHQASENRANGSVPDEGIRQANFLQLAHSFAAQETTQEGEAAQSLFEYLKKLPTEAHVMAFLSLCSVAMLIMSYFRQADRKRRSAALGAATAGGPASDGLNMHASNAICDRMSAPSAGPQSSGGMTAALISTVGLLIFAIGAAAALRAHLTQQAAIIRPSVVTAACGQCLLLLGLIAIGITRSRTVRARAAWEIETIRTELGRLQIALAAAAYSPLVPPWQPMVPQTGSHIGHAAQLAQIKAQLACLSQQLCQLTSSNRPHEIPAVEL